MEMRPELDGFSILARELSKARRSKSARSCRLALMGAAGAAALGLMPTLSFGQTILNPSFEATPVGAGSTTQAGTSWTYSGNAAGVYNPTGSTLPAPADGTQCLFVNTGQSVTQDIGKIGVGVTYTLTAAVGKDGNAFPAGFEMELRAGSGGGTNIARGYYGSATSQDSFDTAIAAPTGAGIVFISDSITSNATATTAAAGQDLYVTVFANPGGTQMLFDNFTLTKTASDPTQLTWTGSTSNVWDTAAADNFQNATGTTTQFVNGSSKAYFLDNPPGASSVITANNISIQAGGVQPVAVTVGSSAVNYTFTDSDGVTGINGSTGLVKSGTSLLTLAGPNSFTGAVNIAGGTLSVAVSGALGSASSLTVQPGGILSIESAGSIPSNMTVTLNKGSDLAYGLLFNTTSGSTINFNSAIVLQAESAISTQGATLNLASNISGPGGLSFNSLGPVVASGSNTYTGDTIVTTGDVTLTGSINAANTAGAGFLSVAPFNSFGRFTLSGGTANFNSTTRNNQGTNSAPASIVVQSGNLNIAGTMVLSTGATAYAEYIANGGTANFSGGFTPGVLGTGVVTLNAGSTTNVIGGQSLVVGNFNTGVGVVTLNGGLLKASSVQLFGSGPATIYNGGFLAFNGGTLKANNSTPAFVTGQGSTSIYSGGATIDDGGNAVTISTPITSPQGSGVTSVGVLYTGSGYSFAPVVQFAGGTLAPGGAPATGTAIYSGGQVTGVNITSPGNYISTAGLGVTFLGGGGSAPSLNGINTATNTGGSLNKVGVGTLTLSGSNTYSGSTQISAGTLQVAGPGASVPIVNPTFEATTIPSGGYLYSPADPAGGWTYNSNGGSIAGAGLTNGGPGFQTVGGIPYSTQAAFLQRLGFIQQTVTFPTAGMYTLSFYTEQRVGYTGQTLDVVLDSGAAGAIDVAPAGVLPGITWAQTFFTFNESAGTHTVTIKGLSVAENAAYVDDVALSAAYVGGATNAIPDTSAVVIADNAKLDVNNSIETIGSLAGTALSTVTLGSGTLTTGNDGTNTTFAGGISGTGAVVKIGTGVQTFSGSNSYTGGTNISAGKISFAAPGALPLFTGLTVGAGASAIASNVSTGSTKNTLFVTGLSLAGSTGAWTGRINLTNNDLVVRNGSIGTVYNQVAQGYSNGTWQNSGGIVSSTAASDSNHLTALGVIQNSIDGTTTAAALYTTFDGQTVSNADVLVKYTYYGDANLSGVVDGSDYTKIDNGYTSGLTGWFNGDFNYDGVIDGSDYTLIDNAFNTQGASLAAVIASPTAQIASAGTAAVPEPASLSLLALGAVGLLGRRRRSI